MAQNYTIHPDIRKAHTLPTSFYTDPSIYEQLKEQVFAQSWQVVGTTADLPENSSCYPFTLLENCLEEPLVLTKDMEGNIRCLSNVCTHRGNILVQKTGKKRMLSCNYHGRCFHLDGRFKSMPEFKETENFPSPADHLPELPTAEFGTLIFTSLSPSVPFHTLIKEMKERLEGLPLHTLTFDPITSRDYFVNANWALYCDNYLEGFHVPFVHEKLGQNLDYGSYSTEIFNYCNLQLSIANEGVPTIALPPNSPDHGKNIYAYYYWVFPNMMFNFYPWGLSLNIVKPLGINQTKIEFKNYLYDGFTPEDIQQFPIHETEMEDEEVVFNVQKGVRSRLYHQGRFSPTQEKGVHHFHQLIAKALKR